MHETKSFFNILSIHRKFSTYKMQDANAFLDHINKVMATANQYVCLEVIVRDKNIVIILLKCILVSYGTMSIKEFTMHYWRCVSWMRCQNVRRKTSR